MGDWVILVAYDENKAIIHDVFPRYSAITRKSAGKSSEKQIIASNIDFGLIVQSADRDFNLNRADRYISICHSSKVHPILILTKVDLVDQSELELIHSKIQVRYPEIQFHAINNISAEGIQTLQNHLNYGFTYCLLGSSGVGKRVVT